MKSFTERSFILGKKICAYIYIRCTCIHMYSETCIYVESCKLNFTANSENDDFTIDVLTVMVIHTPVIVIIT